MKHESSILEEIVNAITHGIGILLSIVGYIIFLILANKNFSLEKTIGFNIFGLAIISSYTISTLYHSLIFTKAKKIFKILDHCTIFLLIAGTYTPFMLDRSMGEVGLILLVAIWIFTILGIIFKVIFVNKFRKLSLVFYTFMGWFIIFGVKPLLAFLPLPALCLLISGGLFYTFGIIFYAQKSLRFNHGIWHIFVLMGSICHFFAMFYL